MYVSVRALKGKRLELSTPKSADMRSMARTDLTSKAQNQGHMVIKCVAGVGLHVDTTVHFSSIIVMFIMFAAFKHN